MLILADTDGLGIDLNKLRKRILYTARDGSRTSLSHIKVRELFGSELACGINRCARLVCNDIGKIGLVQLMKELNYNLLRLT